jgi:hypothetical protein
MLRRLGDAGSWLTVYLHTLAFGHPHQSLCARAWEKRDASPAARLFVRMVGPRHCERSWRWHRDHPEPWNVM